MVVVNELNWDDTKFVFETTISDGHLGLVADLFRSSGSERLRIRISRCNFMRPSGVLSESPSTVHVAS
jgi:hypothetical protein